MDANTNPLLNLFRNRVTAPVHFPPPEGAMLYEVMDHTGDSKYIWSKANADEVAVAKHMFESFTKPRSEGGKGFAAFHVTDPDGAKGTQMRTFDPNAERVIFVPPLAGG